MVHWRNTPEQLAILDRNTPSLPFKLESTCGGSMKPQRRGLRVHRCDLSQEMRHDPAPMDFPPCNSEGNFLGTESKIDEKCVDKNEVKCYIFHTKR